MSKKSSEAAPIYVTRMGDKLMGEMEMDRDAIRRFPAGERIRVDLRTGRVPARIRWYWQFLHAVIKATEAAPDAESLHELIKLSTGYTTPILVRGMPFMVPRSISFASMSEEEFSVFLQRAERFIAESFGISPQDIGEAA